MSSTAPAAITDGPMGSIRKIAPPRPATKINRPNESSPESSPIRMAKTPEVPQDAALVAKAIMPDYALGGHTASLGLCWMPAGTLPGFPDGMAIGQHGSWNRSTLSGYKLVFVPFENGRPSGPPRDILSGFLAPDEKESYGRPVGVTLGPDGSLLMADDVGDVIWRVTGA